MKRRTVLKGLLGAIPVSLTSYSQAAALISQLSITEDALHFEPTWASLQQYRVPDWFRDAKFGIRAHWGAQSQPGPRKLLNQWKAEKWHPNELLTLFRSAGAKYFIALANDVDNFDLFNSKHHASNSVRVGPGKDIIAQWLNASRNQGLYFGTSLHASHAYTQRSTDGLSLAEFSENFFRRTIDLIDQHEPDLLYFDDTALPFWPANDVGLRIAAHLYNKSIFRKGKVQAVINSKRPDPEQRKCLVWSAAVGETNGIEALPWQEDFSLGNLYYDQRIYDSHDYRQPATVIARLADVVSRNGNILLNVPVRGDGTMDADTRTILEAVGKWMAIYSECIYATRPWKVFGEGPSVLTGALLQKDSNEKTISYTGQEIRYTSRGRHIYAISLDTPSAHRLTLQAAGTKAGYIAGNIERVVMVGSNTNLEFSRSAECLSVTIPPRSIAELPFAIKITTSGVANNIP